MRRTVAPSPIYMDFIESKRRNAEQYLFDATIKKIFNGKVPNDIDRWVDFVKNFSYHENQISGEYAYIISFATFKNCGVEILKQDLNLEPHITIKRNSVAVDVGAQRYYVPIEYANMQDLIDISIKIGQLNESLAKMQPEKAKKSKEYAKKQQLVSLVIRMSAGNYENFLDSSKIGITEKDRQEALVNALKENLIKRKILPPETTFKKYHLGKTLDEAYSNCKKIVEKLSQKCAPDQQHQQDEQTQEL